MAPTRQKNASPPSPELANGHDVDGNATQVEVVESADGVEVTGLDSSGDTAPTDPGVEELKRQLADERRRREDLETEANNLRNQRQADQREVVDNRVLVLDATIQRQEGEKQDLIRQKIEAKEAGDYRLEAELDDKLQTLNIDLKQTKLGKARLEAEIEDPQSQQQSQQREDGDPLEAFISKNPDMHPRAARWLREHRDFALDRDKNAKLLRAHSFAMGHEDVEINSDRYFEIIEERLGLRAPADQGADPQEERRSAMPPPAPPSRGNGVGGGNGVLIDHGEGRVITDLGNGKIHISRAMSEYAISIGMQPAEYAKEALALKRSGQLH